jgi:hypothetical protein
MALPSWGLEASAYSFSGHNTISIGTAPGVTHSQIVLVVPVGNLVVEEVEEVGEVLEE